MLRSWIFSYLEVDRYLSTDCCVSRASIYILMYIVLVYVPDSVKLYIDVLLEDAGFIQQ